MVFILLIIHLCYTRKIGLADRLLHRFPPNTKALQEHPTFEPKQAVARMTCFLRRPGYKLTDSNVLVGTLVIKSKFSTVDGKFLERNYRGDCKIDFFSFSEEKGIRTCLNSSLDMIIPNIRYDICKIHYGNF